MSTIRTRRVADLLRQLVAELIARAVHDPRIHGVHITDVTVSTDLRHATLYFSVVPGGTPEREAAAVALAHASGFLRREVGRQIRLRVTPTLRFVPDQTVEYAAHIEEILADIHRQDEASDRSDAGQHDRGGSDEAE